MERTRVGDSKIYQGSTRKLGSVLYGILPYNRYELETNRRNRWLSRQLTY